MQPAALKTPRKHRRHGLAKRTKIFRVGQHNRCPKIKFSGGQFFLDMAMRSVQEIFMCATYVTFYHLPSGGLSGFFRKFLCTRRSTMLNRQYWGLLRLASIKVRCRQFSGVSFSTQTNIINRRSYQQFFSWRHLNTSTRSYDQSSSDPVNHGHKPVDALHAELEPSIVGQ